MSGRCSGFFSSSWQIRLSSQTGHVQDEARRPLELALDVQHEHVHGVLGVERLAAGDQLVEDDAERIEVGFVGDVAFALALLRRHVGGGADGAVGGGQGGDVEVLGDAEVGELERAVGQDHEVGRLEVAVDDAGLVGVLQGGAELLAERRRPPPRSCGRGGP